MKRMLLMMAAAALTFAACERERPTGRVGERGEVREEPQPGVGGAGQEREMKTIVGRVTQVERNQIQVTTPEGQQVQLQADQPEQVQVMMGEQQLSLDQLQEGQQVRATFTTTAEGNDLVRLEVMGQ